jgi:hypothetical protein
MALNLRQGLEFGIERTERHLEITAGGVDQGRTKPGEVLQ